MDYEERICCFIDVVGFKSAIDQSVVCEKTRLVLYGLISGLSEQIFDVLSSSIPYLAPNGLVFDVNKGRDFIENKSSLVVTQFSDSFVISCNASDLFSFDFLLRAIYIINLEFFYQMGMMVRGGVAVGKLVHTKSGALFGPAMNEAYELESKFAIYPRVIFSENAENNIRAVGGVNSSILKPLQRSFDGHCFVDVVSVFDWDAVRSINLNGSGFLGVEEQLRAIEQDVKNNAIKAHPKIAYLIDRWNLRAVTN